MQSFVPLIYLLPAAGIGLLWLRARRVRLPAGAKAAEKGIRRAFAGIGLYLYEKLPFFDRKGGAQVSADLSVLEPRAGADDARRLYYADKIGMTLLVVFAGSVLACVVSFSARQERVVGENGTISRRDYGGGERRETLVIAAADGDAFEREIVVSVTERQYSKEEADALFAEAAARLPEVILNGNVSTDEVRSDLKLVDAMEGYPFSIAWKIGNYDLIHSDGKLQEEHLSAEGEVVMLTARFSYLDYTWEQEVPVCLYSPLYSKEELWEQGMQTLLHEADQATVHESSMTLPGKIGESAYVWTSKVEDDAAILFLLTMLAAMAVFVMKDRDLERRARERENELIGDYPQFVSKLTLYLGAGMTVRNVFYKLAGDYAERRRQGESMRFLYEELCRAVNELESGVSETAVYEHFSFRCRLQQYIRLCTLLTQNLRKGNGELMPLLHEESNKALAERMDRARKRGEEAGTKLLLPMMLMLIVVMVIIMIPAYLSF